MKNYKTPIILFAVFEIIAVSLWLATGSLFYLLNFSYIGTVIGVGLALSKAGWKYAREFIQFGVGAYMLVFLGLICRENMQIEGFWYYLFSGVVGAGVLHYLIAKIFGPILFGRGWCGYACWTAMILDLLPYKQPQGPRKKNPRPPAVPFRQSQQAHPIHAVSHRQLGLLCGGHSSCRCVQGQPRLLQIHLSRHGLPQADEPLLLATHPLRREQMHPVWQMLESVPDGC